jgi:hypothetical protein
MSGVEPRQLANTSASSFGRPLPGGEPPAPEGSIVLEQNSIFAVPGHPAIPAQAEWTGELIHDGMYVPLSASSRGLLLAARALKLARGER